MKDFDTLPAHFAAVLSDADELHIFQIASEPINRSAHLADHSVVRSVEIEIAAQKRDFASAIAQGIEESDDHARCFIPHHGLRATRGEQVLEMAICFECDWIRATFGDQVVSFATTRRAEPLFDHHFPEYATSRDFWKRIQLLSNDLDSYSLPIPRRIESSLKRLDELQQDLEAQPELEDRDRMNVRLAKLKAALHERATP